jgi:hypothetical protein
MSIDRVNELERELRTVDRHLAHPFDLADQFQLEERRAAIIKEARDVLRSINATEPEWCHTAQRTSPAV